MCTRKGSGWVPAARSWKSVRLPPKELVDTTACDRNSESQIGQWSSMCWSVVIFPPSGSTNQIGNFCARLLEPLRMADIGRSFPIPMTAVLLGRGVTCILPPSRPPAPPICDRSLMLINLLPDFFAVLNSTDRTAAYLRYFDAHRPLLEAYWHNYVLDPDGPHFPDVVRSAAMADRTDLRTMLERTDVVALARQTEQQCAQLLVRMSTSTLCSWSRWRRHAGEWSSTDTASPSRASSTSRA